MKTKYIICTFLISFSFGMVKAQASLPTTWDFSNTPTPPKGWSYDLGTGSKTVYTTGSYVKTNPALRLDFGQEYVKVFFADEPGNFLYHLAGTGGNPWKGTVEIQESSNDTNYTIIKSYVDGDITGTSTLDSVTLNSASRYARIFFKSKTSGYNLAVDDVTVRKAPPKPEAEIDIAYEGANVISGSELETGNSTIIPIAIANAGTADKLYISNITMSGPNASDFTPSFVVDSINPLTNKILNINFTPSGALGDKKAVLTITSNDANEGTYQLNIYAINGSLATEPSLTGYTFTAPITNTWKKELSINPGANQPTGWILIQSSGALSSSAMDGTNYEVGMPLGNGKILGIGLDTSPRMQEVIANTPYEYNLFPYHGYGNYINYSASPLKLNLSASPSNYGNYYQGISTSDPLFIGKLQSKINPHFQIYYSNYPSTIIRNFYERDTIGGRKVITGQYSNYLYVYQPPFNFDTMSREHVYPYSWMAETDQDKPNYSDLHNLHPVHQNSANGIRSNYPLGNVNQVIFQFNDGKFGRDQGNNLVYEPRDEQKGACARSMFYMLACYNGADGRTWHLNVAQSEELLKSWHQSYPPNNFEIARNDYIGSIQNNRNPFIDSPKMACFIHFRNMTYNEKGATDCSGINSAKGLKTNATLQIHPNPSTEIIRLKLNKTEDIMVALYDVYGKKVLSQMMLNGEGVIKIKMLNKGSYLVIAEGKNTRAVQKIIRQ